MSAELRLVLFVMVVLVLSEVINYLDRSGRV